MREGGVAKDEKEIIGELVKHWELSDSEGDMMTSDINGRESDNLQENNNDISTSLHNNREQDNSGTAPDVITDSEASSSSSSSISKEDKISENSSDVDISVDHTDNDVNGITSALLMEADARGDQLADTISYDELKIAVGQARRGKAAGVDEIPNEFFKEGGNNFLKKTTELFNVIREEEVIPKEWREGESVLIGKGGDDKIL